MPPSEMTMAEALGAAGYQTHGDRQVAPRSSQSLPAHRERLRSATTGCSTATTWTSPDHPLRLYRDAAQQPGDVDQSLLDQRPTPTKRRPSSAAPAIEPFLLYLAYTMPHVPLHASERFAGTSKRGALRRRGARRSTGASARSCALCATPDSTTAPSWSSPATTDRWLPRKLDGGSAGLLREGKNTTYEGGMRVPCIVRWPGADTRRSGARRARDFSRSLPDVPRARGHRARRPESKLDGSSLLPLLEGRSLRRPSRSFYYFQGALLEAVREGKWKYREAPAASSPNMSGDSAPTYLAALERIAAEGRSLAAFEVDPAVKMEAELYDLEVDPSERFNVAAEHPELARRLKAQMQTFAHGLVPGAGVRAAARASSPSARENGYGMASRPRTRRGESRSERTTKENNVRARAPNTNADSARLGTPRLVAGRRRPRPSSAPPKRSGPTS